MKNSTSQNITNFERRVINDMGILHQNCFIKQGWKLKKKKKRPLNKIFKGTEVVGLFTMNWGSVLSFQNLSLEKSVSCYNCQLPGLDAFIHGYYSQFTEIKQYYNNTYNRIICVSLNRKEETYLFAFFGLLDNTMVGASLLQLFPQTCPWEQPSMKSYSCRLTEIECSAFFNLKFITPGTLLQKSQKKAVSRSVIPVSLSRYVCFYKGILRESGKATKWINKKMWCSQHFQVS